MNNNRCREIEKTIIKRYRKNIWSKFVKAVKEYELIKDNDKIAVCISGGKDSMLLAKCMQELQRHGQIKFDLEFIVMDPGYPEHARELIKNNAEILNIPITVFKANIFEYVTTITDSPCYICARMRRGNLYSEAKKLGCNKIALGHHYNDVIETILLGLFYNGEIKTMLPKLHSRNFEGMELIRPLYLIKEQDIIRWREFNQLNFINCSCKFAEESLNNQDKSKSKRLYIKNLIKKLSEDNKFLENNIFKCVDNINLDAIMGYHSEKGNYYFLDDYEKREECEDKLSD